MIKGQWTILVKPTEIVEAMKSLASKNAILSKTEYDSWMEFLSRMPPEVNLPLDINDYRYFFKKGE